jgi:hypothetical protein
MRVRGIGNVNDAMETAIDFIMNHDLPPNVEFAQRVELDEYFMKITDVFVAFHALPIGRDQETPSQQGKHLARLFNAFGFSAYLS